MSTICKLAIMAEAEAVQAAVETFLRERGFGFTLTQSEWPAAWLRDVSFCGDKFPSIFSLKQVTSDVTEIHFNSFAKLEDMASHLSGVLNTKLVLNIYQSVSTASSWAYYANGKQIRTIEAGENGVSHHSGERLPFEGPQPGQVDKEDESWIYFNSDTQDWYNREVGVPIEVYQDCDSGWLNFVLETYEERGAIDGKSAVKKRFKEGPWWRVW